MSSPISSAAPSATSNTCAQVPYQIPVTDIACAVATTNGLPSNYGDLMKGCCKDAPVEKYASDCGLYCLSIGQSVSDLTSCFQDAGINPGYIFCNGNNTATATATEAPSSTSGAKATNSDGSKPEESKGAAAAMVPRQSVSKAGLAMMAVLFVSVAAGTVM